MKRLRIALAVATLALLIPAPAHAAGPASWSVSPSDADGPDGRAALDLHAPPGSTLTEHVAVANLGDGELTVALYASDARTTPTGGFDLLPAGTPPTDVGAWITPAAPALTIPARSRTVVPVTVRIPDDATPGDHVGGIVAAVRENAADGVIVERRTGTRVHLRVPGELRPLLTVTDVTAEYAGSPWPWRPGSLRIAFTVANTGNVRLTGTAAVTVTGALGIATGTAAPVAIPQLLPGAEYTTESTVDGVWPLLALSAEVTATPAAVDGEPPATTPVSGTADATAIPWPQLTALAVLAGLVWTVRWLIRRHRRRIAERVRAAVDAALAAKEKA